MIDFSYNAWPSGEPYEWLGCRRSAPHDTHDFHVDLGCGTIKKGRIGIDRYPAPGVDVVMNLDELVGFAIYDQSGECHDGVWSGLPFEDSSIESIISHHCHPTDEPILTTQGLVPIGELDDSLRLAGCSSRLTWGGGRGVGRSTPIAERGFPFARASRPYVGDLLHVEARSRRTRVTPNHRVLARLRPEFFTQHAVYLMRRGKWWRIGSVGMRRSGDGNVTSLLGRRVHQKADGLWILGVFPDRKSAWLEEQRLQAQYGVTGVGFEPGSSTSFPAGELHEFHDALASHGEQGARRLLGDHGLLAHYPLLTRQTFRSNKCFATAAANLRTLGRHVEVPVAPDDFMSMRCGTADLAFERAQVTTAPYRGTVASLDVPPYHHYVSGGVVVHNCLEHIGDGFIPLIDEVYRVLRPGALFRAITPLFPSRTAVEDPDHRRYFMERTWDGFCGEPDNCWLSSFSVPYTRARFKMLDRDMTPVRPQMEWHDDREMRVALEARK